MDGAVAPSVTQCTARHADAERFWVAVMGSFGRGVGSGHGTRFRGIRSQTLRDSLRARLAPVTEKGTEVSAQSEALVISSQNALESHSCRSGGAEQLSLALFLIYLPTPGRISRILISTHVGCSHATTRACTDALPTPVRPKAEGCSTVSLEHSGRADHNFANLCP